MIDLIVSVIFMLFVFGSLAAVIWLIFGLLLGR